VAGFYSATRDRVMPPLRGLLFARDELALITQAAIIEWLGRRGTFSMSPFQRKTSLLRWVKAHALSVLPVVMILGITVGLILCRLARLTSLISNPGSYPNRALPAHWFGVARDGTKMRLKPMTIWGNVDLFS
jgi:hypothetical protein